MPIRNAKTILTFRKLVKSHLFDHGFPTLAPPCWRACFGLDHDTWSRYGFVRLWARSAEFLYDWSIEVNRGGGMTGSSYKKRLLVMWRNQSEISICHKKCQLMFKQKCAPPLCWVFGAVHLTRIGDAGNGCLVIIANPDSGQQHLCATCFILGNITAFQPIYLTVVLLYMRSPPIIVISHGE